MSHSAQTLTLHIWPSKWDLPSIEPSCIAAAFYLQLALPGRFSIQECTDPDASPSGRSVSAEVVLPCALKRFFFVGQLPYLSHGHHTVAPLSSIVKYVAALTPATMPPVTDADGPEPAFSADVDALLSTTERARRTAWIAHIESALGDLVVRCRRLPRFPHRGNSPFLQAHAFYCVPANYTAVMHPTLASFYNIPQSYYVPRRIRQVYQARLEANGLWSTSAEESEAEKPKSFGEKETEKDDPKLIFKNAFQRERVGHSNCPSGIIRSDRKQVLEKSRAAFDLYVRLLGDENFFFYDRCARLQRMT
jgi:sorting and assembly machinery component 37